MQIGGRKLYSAVICHVNLQLNEQKTLNDKQEIITQEFLIGHCENANTPLCGGLCWSAFFVSVSMYVHFTQSTMLC